MRIAAWNVERLHNKALLGKIPDECSRINADTLVLTETETDTASQYPRPLLQAQRYKSTNGTMTRAFQIIMAYMLI